MPKIKKTLFTVCVDNYAPQITAITYPLLQKYADKIGADFHVITDRKSPTMPPVYEKLQIYDLGRQMENDWNIYIDSDALVHPETIDFTEMITKDVVMHNGCDMANIRWKYDDYFRRDGRNIGSCNWFTIGSDWCIDLWRPLDIPYAKALANILPIPNELNHGVTREHLIDDYTLSRNIAKFGLHFMTVIDLLPTKRLPNSGFFWHEYTISIYEKIRKMKEILKIWEVYGKRPVYHQPSPEIGGWMLPEELQWLYENALEAESIVEIGTWEGRSTHALSAGCKGKVYTVDHFKGSLNELETTHVRAKTENILDIALLNLQDCNNVEIMAMSSQEASEKFQPHSIDMVFIDGDHEEKAFENDLKLWMPIARKLICGHDYYLVKGVLDRLGLKPYVECKDIWSIEVK